jgi:hypothetical protein
MENTRQSIELALLEEIKQAETTCPNAAKCLEGALLLLKHADRVEYNEWRIAESNGERSRGWN